MIFARDDICSPRMVTLLDGFSALGNLICTDPASSIIERMMRPLAPIRVLCSLGSILTSSSYMSGERGGQIQSHKHSSGTPEVWGRKCKDGLTVEQNDNQV